MEMQPTHMADNKEWVIEGRGLTKRYGPGCSYCDTLTGPEKGNRCPVCSSITACSHINFALAKGEILGIVGESGSGKSTLMQLVNLAVPTDKGELWYRELSIPGQDSSPVNLFTLDKYARRTFRNQRLGIVYQRPELGLNMNFSVGGNVAEKLLLADWRHVGRIRQRTSELMQLTELPIERIDDEPRMFSGGMLQRVQISKALSSNPAVLLLDEVTSGLDLSVQAKVLDLLRRIQWELKITMLLVSHDLGVIKQLAGRTIVMKNGYIVEQGLTDQILEDPQHPYTQLLVSSAL